MAKALAYLISVGMVGFGVWIISRSPGSILLWLAGSGPAAVGLLSLLNEINSTNSTTSHGGGPTGP
jgi:hypothetical protein